MSNEWWIKKKWRRERKLFGVTKKRKKKWEAEDGGETMRKSRK